MMREIPLLDLKEQYRTIKKEINAAIQNVLNDAAFSGGPYVGLFEKHFAKYNGAPYTVGLNSGTSALYLALIALNIKAGDEVIVPVNTFIATAWAVSYVGAKPVFADCTRDTWQIDPSKLERKINRKTKAIIGVHLFGQPFNIDRVMATAKKYKLVLIEDCAQAHGGRYKGKKVGMFGDIGCFSFYPSKNLGAYGEGGAIVTKNLGIAQRIRSLRNHGSLKKYYHTEIGFNMRMDGIQAAILDVKLNYLERWNKRRRQIAHMYQTQIKNPHIVLQYQPLWSGSVYHLFVIKTKRREKFMRSMEKNRIMTAIHYPIPCHLQKAYNHLGYKTGDFPVAESYSKQCVSIPMYPEMTDSEAKKVIEAINRYEG
ncbi:DegT/DnrJ/EryC1/StrS family aminotransferase [Candidatus Roizmanbacteria bacterium]|nr:DegT/DnrJ/EryC1/StrS family aminotransferase [Candidatus Roizmanbacteria bacterium]